MGQDPRAAGVEGEPGGLGVELGVGKIMTLHFDSRRTKASWLVDKPSASPFKLMCCFKVRQTKSDATATRQ